MVEGDAVSTSLFALPGKLAAWLSRFRHGHRHDGIEAVGDLDMNRVADGVRLTNRTVHFADDDVLLGWDVAKLR